MEVAFNTGINPTQPWYRSESRILGPERRSQHHDVRKCENKIRYVIPSRRNLTARAVYLIVPGMLSGSLIWLIWLIWLIGHEDPNTGHRSYLRNNSQYS
jgi:hypothetical protein